MSCADCATTSLEIPSNMESPVETTTAPTVVIVPGLRGHVAGHWQNHLAADLGKVQVVDPLTTNRLELRAQVEGLEATIAAVDGPVVLVAHSAGVLTTAHWARQTSRVIDGALLATPPDVEIPMSAPHPTLDQLEAGGWLPIPRWTLPFPSIVAASTNDPLAELSRVSGMAESWGSRVVEVGAVGHLNPAAGFGPWDHAKVLLNELNNSFAQVRDCAT